MFDKCDQDNKNKTKGVFARKQGLDISNEQN
jgi:hypothetical protein